jgi:hypothetical protein
MKYSTFNANSDIPILGLPFWAGALPQDQGTQEVKNPFDAVNKTSLLGILGAKFALSAGEWSLIVPYLCIEFD